MPKRKHLWFGVLVLAFACGQAKDTAGPDIAIEESRITTPAGTEHVQVFVPAGKFTMGTSDGPDNERPLHEVELDAFYIDKYEVTNTQYLAFSEATGAERPQFIREDAFNQPNQPVVGTLWNFARDYCHWAGLQLPSEAQWEKAASGGDGRIYPWGDTSPTELQGNFNFTSGPIEVGSFPAGVSPYGAYDMAGNVWEWTIDEYEHTYYNRSPVVNPVNLKSEGLDDGADRTLRGGGWFSAARNIRIPVRSSLAIMDRQYEENPDVDNTLMFARIGFRCARNISN
ncbi:MAG: formylglycine-generating enzyme family protein [Candidatus Latescibacteria bacterium]|nr:formylglycine-generating enzyme family protein [Candidatus Latescibacterota bacterium]MBT4138194.1 formylglycine-generating enzyme family protein [Candidatus Latescibacterota bacterium]MBT5830173.1 formylglycine-generating enzyme family protein [Candidatus Latescibacterota bacterium]